MGALDDVEEATFGSIRHVAVAKDGSIFLYDSQVPGIFRFDSTGRLAASIGRKGEGPGEYSDDVAGMIVSGERLLVADPGNSRLSAFALDGTYQTSLGKISGLRSLFRPTIAPGPSGGVATQVLTVRPEPGVKIPTPWPIGLEVRTAEGAVIDTIAPQTILGEVGRLVAGPSGDGVLVDSSEQFLFELRRESGAVIRVQMPFTRAEFTEAERRMLGQVYAPAAAADGKSEVNVSTLKGPYLEYFYSQNGHVWARRPIVDRFGEPSWRAPLYQPSVLDVFDPDGRYMGLVPLPPRSRPVVVTDTQVYLVELGAYDEPYLVRYGLEVPSWGRSDTLLIR